MSGAIVLRSEKGSVSFGNENHIDARDIRVEGRVPSQPHSTTRVEIGLIDDNPLTYPFLNTVCIKNLKIADGLFRSLLASNPTKLELDDCVLDEGQANLLTTSIKTNEKLQTLALPRTKLSSEETIRLLEALKASRVERLELEGYGLEKSVLDAVSEFLKGNEYLKKLSFSPSTREKGDPSWTEAFAKAIQENRVIEEITIAEPREKEPGSGRYCLYEGDMAHLLEGLRSNRSLTKWDIGSSPWHASHALFDAKTWVLRWGKAALEWNNLLARGGSISRDNEDD